MKKIPLSKTGKNKGKYEAIVDDDLFEEINKFDWCYSHGYAHNGKMKILLHRYIWLLKYRDIPDDKEVEHKDRNPLNCKISNLRLATHSQNMRNIGKQKNNTSGFIGVSKCVNKGHHRKDGTYKIYPKWYCSWTDSEGKRRAKPFPFDNVGRVRAARYFDLMVSQSAGTYTGELNFQSLSEYQKELSKAILKDVENNSLSK